jgi:hypothetical protein
MKNIYLPIVVFILFFENSYAIGKNDSLISKRDQINIGTTGFFLPEFGIYSISARTRDPFSWRRMIFSHLSYETKLNNKYALFVAYNAYRSKVKITVFDPEDFYSWNAKATKMFIFSLGINRSLEKKINIHLSLNTKLSSAVQLRKGTSTFWSGISCFIIDNQFYNLGLKAAISEELIIKQRLVLGINLGLHGFFQANKNEYSVKHNYITTNALYLGMKF